MTCFWPSSDKPSNADIVRSSSWFFVTNSSTSFLCCPLPLNPKFMSGRLLPDFPRRLRERLRELLCDRVRLRLLRRSRPRLLRRFRLPLRLLRRLLLSRFFFFFFLPFLLFPLL